MAQELTNARDKRRIVESCVASQVTRLQRGILSDENYHQAAARLAKLRRAAGKGPDESPELWGIEFGSLPDSLLGYGDVVVSPSEWAIHVALTTYATHQQSQDMGMYRATNPKEGDYYDIGNAVRRYVSICRSKGKGEQIQDGEMPRRFAALVTAESIQEVAHYARQLAQQLRTESLPFDYARFAGQLYDYQNPYTRNSVRLVWSREFARYLEVPNGDVVEPLEQ